MLPKYDKVWERKGEDEDRLVLKGGVWEGIIVVHGPLLIL